MHLGNPSLRFSFFTLVLAACFLHEPAGAAEWQWSIPVPSEKPDHGPARAFLWIPPQCQQLHGIVLAQHNMEEISILENPIFRNGLAELSFAEIWVAPPFDHLFRFDQGAGDTFNNLVSRLADESGYSELKIVPVVPMGHSAAASWPYYFAAWNPDRTLAVLSISGQWPYFRDRNFAPDIWGSRTVDFVPCLESMGEYESAATWSREGLHERQTHPLTPLSMLANPGEGHFASSDKKAAYLALYLRKAAQYRLPENLDLSTPPRLRPIDPTKSGWLAEKWKPDQAPSTPPAPVAAYRGDPKQAFWFFDEEIATATIRHQAEFRGLKPQLLGFVQNGITVPQDASHLQVTLKFIPESDGLTFKLSAAFYDSVPPGSPRPAAWTGLPAGSPIGHSPETQSISIDPICGPVAKIAPDTYRIDFQRETLLNANAPSHELVFAATHPGDREYKSAVQQAHLYIPARNAQGADQAIDFPEIPDQKLGTKTVELKATSSANARISYSVLHGPAEIDGQTLRLTPPPPRSKFPISITVVAWQFGRATEPKLKTAAPVQRTFRLQK